MTPEKCGTSAGYQAHRRAHETPCDACREAFNKYQREYLAKNKDKRSSNKYRVTSQKQGKALRLLAIRYPEIYSEIMDTVKND